MPEPTHLISTYTRPSFIDNRLYSIHGDLKELRRHVGLLVDDLAFFSGRLVVNAIDRFDDANLQGARRRVIQNPRLAILVCCVAGAVIGAATARAMRA